MTRHWALALAMSACASPAGAPPESRPKRVDLPAPTPSGASASTPTPDREKSATPSAEQAAFAFFEAMFARNLEGMRAHSLTHAELDELSRRAPPEAEYVAELDEFLRGRVREMTDAPPGTVLLRVEVERTETFPAEPEGKRRKDVKVAWVHPVFRADGAERTGMAFLFIETKGGVKFSVRH